MGEHSRVLRSIDEHLVMIVQGNGNPSDRVTLRIALQGEGARLPVAVGGAVMERRIVQKVPPVYPANAKAARVQGAVQLGIIIGPDGKVQNVRSVSGVGMLMQAAMDAVKQWVYQPFLLNGQPVSVQTTANVNFVLQ